MLTPFTKAFAEQQDPAEARVPEVVPIEELSPRALDAAAREIAEEQPAPTEKEQVTCQPGLGTPPGSTPSPGG